MSNRTLIYARVSTDDQVEKYGLPVQLRACRDFARSREYEIIEEISDEGISGATMDRPGLSRLRDQVRAGAVDVVLMLDVDRLSRELGHLLILKPEIEQRARLEFVSARFEDSVSGRMFFNVRGVIAQYERELTRERTMRGQRERAKQGRQVGGRVPYGYRYVRETGLLVIDESRAVVVRDIFLWYRSGLSIRGIAERLRNSGVATWGGRPWGHSSVRWILGSETYAGMAYWGARYRKPGDDQKPHLCARPKTAWMPLPVPALIDRAEWEQVQSKLAERAEKGAPGRGRPTTQHLLSGLLRCKCGRRMHAEYHKLRSYRSYRCAGRDRLRGCVCKAAVGGSKLDQAVWSEIVRVFGNAALLRAMLEEHQKELRQVEPDRSEHLRGQVARLKRREETALALLLDPDMASDRGTLKAKYRTLQAERVLAEAELARIAGAQRGVVSAADWLHSTTELLAEYIPAITEMADKQQFLKGLSSRVEWSGEEATIHCFIGPEMTSTPRHSVPRESTGECLRGAPPPTRRTSPDPTA